MLNNHMRVVMSSSINGRQTEDKLCLQDTYVYQQLLENREVNSNLLVSR